MKMGLKPETDSHAVSCHASMDIIHLNPCDTNRDETTLRDKSTEYDLRKVIVKALFVEFILCCDS